jgi:hypothetical protein
MKDRWKRFSRTEKICVVLGLTVFLPFTLFGLFFFLIYASGLAITELLFE